MLQTRTYDRLKVAQHCEGAPVGMVEIWTGFGSHYGLKRGLFLGLMGVQLGSMPGPPRSKKCTTIRSSDWTIGSSSERR